MGFNTRQKFALLILLSELLIAGCQLPPIGDSRTNILETTAIPLDWMMKPAKTAEQSNTQWWKRFQNQELNTLIAQAMRDNQTIAAAAIHWQRALLSIDEARLNQQVRVTGNLSAQANQDFTKDINTHSVGTSLSASYQLDIWKKLSTNRKVATWLANASAADLLAAQLSLEGEIAKAYFTLVYLNDKLALNQQQQTYQQRILAIVQAKRQAGASDDIDVAHARQAVITLDNARTELLAAHKQAQITLTTLLGHPPALYTTHDTLSTTPIPTIAIALPADILHQRPDIRAIQYRLQADMGNIAIAERNFYPQIDLSAGISSGGRQWVDIVKNPIGNILGSLTLPFLQYRENTLKLKSSQLQYEADIAAFRQTLYNAFRDVENALIDISKSEQTALGLERQRANAYKVEQLTQIRYKAGAESLQSLLNAIQTQHDIEAQILDNRYQRITQQIALYLALGGDTTRAAEVASPRMTKEN